MRIRLSMLILGFGLATIHSLAAGAQEAGSGLAIELNRAETVEAGCALSFVVENRLDADVAAAVYETVLFDTDGLVDRLTLFDFGTLPAGRPRVRQFVVPELVCARLGRVLINGANRCEGKNLGEAACTDGLELRTRIDVEVVG